MTIPVTQKDAVSSRRGRKRYDIGIGPVSGRVTTLRVSADVFEQVGPHGTCVTLLTEHAPNGAVRVVKPPQFNARYPDAP